MYRVFCGKDRIPYYRCHGINEHAKGCGVMVRIADADAFAAEQVYVFGSRVVKQFGGGVRGAGHVVRGA
jgi:hypothetical protein